MTLCNRGQPLYTLATGISQGAEGGGGFKVSKLNGGEPFIAAAVGAVASRACLAP